MSTVLNISEIVAPSILLREHDVKDENVIELAKDLEANGFINKLTVYPDGTGAFIHADGRQRFTAVKLLASENRAVKGFNVGEIPVNVEDYTPSEEEFLTLQMRGNIHFKTTANKDYAKALTTYSQKFNRSLTEIAKMLNTSTSTLSKWNNVIRLGENVVKLVEANKISLATAQEMVKFKVLEKEPEFLQKASKGTKEFLEWANGRKAELYPPKIKKDNSVFVAEAILKSKTDLEKYYEVVKAEFENDPSPINEGRKQALDFIFSLDALSVQKQEEKFNIAKANKEAKAEKAKADKIKKEVEKKTKELEDAKKALKEIA